MISSESPGQSCCLPCGTARRAVEFLLHEVLSRVGGRHDGQPSIWILPPLTASISAPMPWAGPSPISRRTIPQLWPTACTPAPSPLAEGWLRVAESGTGGQAPRRRPSVPRRLMTFSASLTWPVGGQCVTVDGVWRSAQRVGPRAGGELKLGVVLPCWGGGRQGFCVSASPATRSRLPPAAKSARGLKSVIN